MTDTLQQELLIRRMIERWAVAATLATGSASPPFGTPMA